MRRTTHKRPHFFKVENEEFKSVALGYLDSAELIIKYLDTLLKVAKKLQEQDETEESVGDEININIEGLLRELPPEFLTNLTNDLLRQTYVRDDISSTNYSLLDPQDFTGVDEHIKVLMEVAKFNFPDFFRGGSVIEEPPVQIVEPVTVPTTHQKPRQFL